MTNNKRRPLNAAMDVSADKLAFIRGGVLARLQNRRLQPPCSPRIEKVEQVAAPVAPPTAAGGSH